MIKTIEIQFYEPYTGILTKGTKSMFFTDEKDFNNWIGKTYVELIKRYGYGIYVGEVEK